MAAVGWGLWNERLTEWFNPGGKKPYFPTKQAAERMIPMANRQYSMGKWELREYFLEDDEDAERLDDATDRPDAARPGTETPAARRPAAGSRA